MGAVLIFKTSFPHYLLSNSNDERATSNRRITKVLRQNIPNATYMFMNEFCFDEWLH